MASVGPAYGPQILATWNAKVEESQVQGQSGSQSDPGASLGNLVRPYIK